MCAPKMNKANTKPESFLDGSPQILTRAQNWVVDTYAKKMALILAMSQQQILCPVLIRTPMGWKLPSGKLT